MLRVGGQNIESFDGEDNGAVEEEEEDDGCVGVPKIVTILIIVRVTTTRSQLSSLE